MPAHDTPHVILTCPACGQRNRVPAARLSDTPRCAGCHQQALPAAPVEVGDAALQGLIRESRLPLLVDFWAPWCGPCRMVAPVLAEVARERAGAVLVAKVNTDEEPAASARHEVSGIPTLVLFSGGGERQRLVGAHPKGTILRMLG